MNTFIAPLRGINVGGQKSILMSDLRNLFQEIGCINTKTYIQSGNVVFQHKQKVPAALVELTENGIQNKFGFQVPVTVKTISELDEVIKRVPFDEIILKEKEKIHITFLSGIPSKVKAKDLSKYSDGVDDFKIIQSEVYLLCRNGYGNTQFSNTFLEKKLELKATTRNLETLKKILSLGCEIAA